mgnify:CR=1 FL=1
MTDTELLDWLEAEALRRNGFQIEVYQGQCLVRTVDSVGHIEDLRSALEVTRKRQEVWNEEDVSLIELEGGIER